MRGSFIKLLLCQMLTDLLSIDLLRTLLATSVFCSKQTLAHIIPFINIMPFNFFAAVKHQAGIKLSRLG